MRAAGALLAAGCALALAGCATTTGAQPSPAIRTLEREARPIGRGSRFVSRARGPILRPCRTRRGARRAAHIEVFAENRVVLIPAGIGVLAPLRRQDGRILAARCYGALITLDPTGVVLFDPHVPVTLADVFRGWGTSLSRTRLAGFAAPVGSAVRVYVNGRRVWSTAPGRLRLAPAAEIVLEVGPYVPPHQAYSFPPGA